MAKELMLVFILLAMAFPTQGEAQNDQSKSELARGVREVEEGDLDAAVITLSAVLPRLSGVQGGDKDLAKAHLYLGWAHIGLGEKELAHAQMREAWRQHKDMTLDPKRFPPRVLQAYEAARREAQAEAGQSEPTPAPPAVIESSSPNPAAPPTQSALLGDRVDCLLPKQFTSLQVVPPDRFNPATGRLYFRSNLSKEYFYTELKPSGPAWMGILPKINKDGGIREITYVFSLSAASSSVTLETEEHIARVVDHASECPAGGRWGQQNTPTAAFKVFSASGSKKFRKPGEIKETPRLESSDFVLPIADAFGFQSLQEGLKDPDPEVRSATAGSLAEMAGLIVRAIGNTVVRLRSKDAGDRKQAGNDLERTGRQAVRGTVEALIGSMTDKNPEIRRSVATILGSLGQALALARAALSAALRDPDRDVRVAATQALTSMGSVVTSTVEALRAAEKREADAQTSEAIVKAYQSIEDALSAQGTSRK